MPFPAMTLAVGGRLRLAGLGGVVGGGVRSAVGRSVSRTMKPLDHGSLAQLGPHHGAGFTMAPRATWLTTGQPGPSLSDFRRTHPAAAAGVRSGAARAGGYTRLIYAARR